MTECTGHLNRIAAIQITINTLLAWGTAGRVAGR